MKSVCKWRYQSPKEKLFLWLWAHCRGWIPYSSSAYHGNWDIFSPIQNGKQSITSEYGLVWWRSTWGKSWEVISRQRKALHGGEHPLHWHMASQPETFKTRGGQSSHQWKVNRSKAYNFCILGMEIPYPSHLLYPFLLAKCGGGTQFQPCRDSLLFFGVWKSPPPAWVPGWLLRVELTHPRLWHYPEITTIYFSLCIYKSPYCSDLVFAPINKAPLQIPNSHSLQLHFQIFIFAINTSLLKCQCCTLKIIIISSLIVSSNKWV